MAYIAERRERGRCSFIHKKNLLFPILLLSPRQVKPRFASSHVRAQRGYRLRRQAQISSTPPGVDFVRPPRGRISFPILHRPAPPPLFGKTIPPRTGAHEFHFGAWGLPGPPVCFPMNALPLFPPDAGITISTLRVDDIRLCRISFPILHRPDSAPHCLGKQSPAHRNGMIFFKAWGYTRAPWRFPMNALPLFPPDAG